MLLVHNRPYYVLSSIKHRLTITEARIICIFHLGELHLLRLWLQSVQYDLWHDFAWVTDEADCSVVLALLQVAFLGKSND